MRFIILFIFIQFTFFAQELFPPQYVGGHIALCEFVAKNGQHIPDSVKNGLTPGHVYLELTIDTVGNIISSRADGGCSECKTEALKIIKLMPKFIPATKNNKKIVSTFKFPISFRGDPDSLLVYKADNLIGKWVIQNESQINCLECPIITFDKNLTATLISDTLNWSINDRKLTFTNKNKPKRLMFFLSNTSYSLKFSKYFKVLEIENSITREKYVLYKTK